MKNFNFKIPFRLDLAGGWLDQPIRLYATEKKYKKILASGSINGCIHCNKQDNTD